MSLLNGKQPALPHRAGDRSISQTFPVRSSPSDARNITLLHHCFEHTCDRFPDDVAVVCESSQLTYLDLDRRANRLAHLLHSFGCREGRPVGLFFERSLDLYIALLGVLKAGAAFVPLDPSFPADRLAFIAEDAELQLLVTSSTLGKQTKGFPCPILAIDQMADALVAQTATRPQIDLDPASLCYLIYTSGTTGQPKGVAVSHANITHFLRAVTPIYAVRRDDRVYQGMTLAFDFSFEEIWPTWIAGATLVAGPTDSRRLGHGLAAFLSEHEISVLYCVPTLLATIEGEVSSLRLLCVGGEACPAELVRRWSRPTRRMLNTYGPTETTVTATWCELVPDRPVTIGVPLPTYRIYLLDEHLRPVKDGEPGEICIGGPGVAMGYLHRPDLTRERFVSNPIPQDREQVPRLYRSGDLGRLTICGEIEYLGRIDTQVKLRGYRIELGEIEEVLRSDQAVENAVVGPLVAGGVAQDLVAYLTLRKSVEKRAIPSLRARLHASLRQRLPSYMVPSFLEVLDTLPMLPAGKVDRSRLPTPTSGRLGARSAPYLAPSTPLESELAGVWEQILGREHLSVEDDFFCDLGGHSLVAAQVISRLRQQPRWQGLGIGDLYAHPTIRDLAQFIEASASPLVDTSRRERARPKSHKHSNRRVLCCGVGQCVALYGYLLLLNVPVLGLHLAMGRSWMLPWLGLAEAVWLGVTSFLLPIVAGRLLMEGVQPGTYPLWGLTYLRWWLYRRILALSPLPLLAGSPLLPPYLRLLGARIGRGCHLASPKLGLPLFLEVGDGTCIGYGAQLQPYSMEGGWLRLAPIHLGREVFLGTNSVVLAGAHIGDQASVGEQSLVPLFYHIPDREHWGGSPCQHLTSVPPVLVDLAAHANRGGYPLRVLAGFGAALLLLLLLPSMMMAPSLLLVEEAMRHGGLMGGVVSTLLAGPLFVLTTCALVVVGKRLVMPAMKPGIYAVRSGFGLRKWVSDQLMAMSLGLTNSLYATLYLLPFLRLLGARIGRWSEISTLAYVDPHLLRIAHESFVADNAVIGPAVFHRGQVALAPTELGYRSFVGNGALLPYSTRLGDHCLIGVYSLPPMRQVDQGTSWLGSPAIFLPRRQESQSFEERVTYRPCKRQIAGRLFIEWFRVTGPATLLSLTILGEAIILWHLAASLFPLAVLALMPFLCMGIGAAATLVIVLLKWLLIGRYRPQVKPLWSLFVRRSELITGLYEAVAVPCLVGLLTGTPWIAPILRLLGARIGRRVWLDTTYLTEFDLVEIADDAAVGEMTSLQTHLFEDRVMKMAPVKIGAASSIGSRSVVLYNAEVGAGASLDSLSLVMKGEVLPAGSHWRGIPACATSRESEAPPVLAMVSEHVYE